MMEMFTKVESALHEYAPLCRNVNGNSDRNSVFKKNPSDLEITLALWIARTYPGHRNISMISSYVLRILTKTGTFFP